ncbi:MAG TPA: hypothetical protein VN604_07405 [Nitrospirota bacterium]|nr:hypothetical protein [Nitrospirota bacterium]
MKNVLLCSSNPLLTKNLYGILREQGCSVDIVEHPSHAVRHVLFGLCDLLIIDAEPFGMQSGEAVEIVRSVAPDLHVLLLGETGGQRAGLPALSTPVDLEKFTQLIHRFAV